MIAYREMLFQLTLITNAIRYFQGDLIGATLGSKIGYHTLTDVPGYFGVVLNPALSDMLPPWPRDDSCMYNRVTIHDAQGLKIRDEHLSGEKGDAISLEDGLSWWGLIRNYVLVENSPYPRLVTMREHYRDYIDDIEAKWQQVN